MKIVITCHVDTLVRELVPDIYIPNASEKIDSFPGYLSFFVAFLLFFRLICLGVLRIFVYLHTVKGVATICAP